jgi:hypothetical protein
MLKLQECKILFIVYRYLFSQYDENWGAGDAYPSSAPDYNFTFVGSPCRPFVFFSVCLFVFYYDYVLHIVNFAILYSYKIHVFFYSCRFSNICVDETSIMPDVKWSMAVIKERLKDKYI